MASRLFAAVILLSVISTSTVSPAEICAIWCHNTHGSAHGLENQHPPAHAMPAHHHAGMQMASPAKPLNVAASQCATRCFANRAALTATPFQRDRALDQAKPYATNHGQFRFTEGDTKAVLHFEVASPPGYATSKSAVLRL